MIQFVSKVEKGVNYNRGWTNDIIFSLPGSQMEYFQKQCILKNTLRGFHVSCIPLSMRGPTLFDYQPKHKITEDNSFYQLIPARHSLNKCKN